MSINCFHNVLIHVDREWSCGFGIKIALLTLLCGDVLGAHQQVFSAMDL